ncbi:hypothetical protein AD997_15580 [Erwinia amylovora]|nr:hypothetical protein AD997_15580 [Erwinia amylovora]
MLHPDFHFDLAVDLRLAVDLDLRAALSSDEARLISSLSRQDVGARACKDRISIHDRCGRKADGLWEPTPVGAAPAASAG